MSGIFFASFIFVFLIIIEILTILFKLTGLTDEKARFQVISIITSTGFTTKESELITQHKKRRVLAQYVMVIGYLGWATIISFIATIINDVLMKTFSFTDALVIIVCLLGIFCLLRYNRGIICLDNIIERIILKTRSSHISKRNIYTMLSRKHGYGIYNIFIEEGSFLIGKSIIESSLKSNEIQILNVDKGDEFISFPLPSYVFEERDSVMVYGKVENILHLFKIR